jgi:3-dehydroquinate synthase
VVGLLERLGLPTWHPALDEPDGDGRPAVLVGLADFREHLGGELTLTLLEGIGRGFDTTSVSEEAILRALAWLRRRSAG